MGLGVCLYVLKNSLERSPDFHSSLVCSFSLLYRIYALAVRNLCCSKRHSSTISCIVSIPMISSCMARSFCSIISVVFSSISSSCSPAAAAARPIARKIYFLSKGTTAPFLFLTFILVPPLPVFFYVSGTALQSFFSKGRAFRRSLFLLYPSALQASIIRRRYFSFFYKI